VDAEDLVQQRRNPGNDLQFELDVVRWRPVVVGLRVERVEVQRREVSGDGRGIALAPAGMVEDRVVNAFEAQRKPE